MTRHLVGSLRDCFRSLKSSRSTKVTLGTPALTKTSWSLYRVSGAFCSETPRVCVGSLFTARSSSHTSRMPRTTSSNAASLSGQLVIGLASRGRTWSFPKGAFIQSTERNRIGITRTSPLSCLSNARCISTPYVYSEARRLGDTNIKITCAELIW